MLTGLSMIGGYVLCAFSFSLQNGSYGNAIDIFTLDHTGHIQIHKENYLKRPKIHKTINNAEEIGRLLEVEADIVSFSARVFAPALAYGDAKTSPASIFGIDVEKEPQTSRITQKVQQGEYFSASMNADGFYSAMIGQGLANTLKMNVGDELVLISQGADGSIANDIYVVSAIVGNKTSHDRQGVYLPLAAAQEFLSLGNDVHEVVIVVDHRDDARGIARTLQDKMPDVTVSPWQVVEATFFKTMEADQEGNYFTMAIIIFIVFIGVLNTVLMSVLERTREFGVLRAIGSRPINIVQMVFLETMLLALISIGIGMVLSLPLILWFTEVGFLLAEPIDAGGVAFQHLRGEFSAFVFFAPMALILSFAAVVSIPPGLRAARVLPRDALGAH